jgi:hypothetical protein
VRTIFFKYILKKNRTFLIIRGLQDLKLVSLKKIFLNLSSMCSQSLEPVVLVFPDPVPDKYQNLPFLFIVSATVVLVIVSP